MFTWTRAAIAVAAVTAAVGGVILYRKYSKGPNVSGGKKGGKKTEKKRLEKVVAKVIAKSLVKADKKQKAAPAGAE